MPFLWTNWGWTSDINEVVLLTAWTMKGSQISPISDRRRHQTMTTSPWISPRNSQRRERNSSTTALNKRRKTHTFSQKTGLWECLCHWLSWWHVSSTPDVTADFLSLSLSLTLVLPNSRECAGGRCISGRGGAFTMSTVREVWRTPLLLPRVSLWVSLWNLWRYFFQIYLEGNALEIKVASWAGRARLDNTTLCFTHSTEAHFGNCKVTRSIWNFWFPFLT